MRWFSAAVLIYYAWKCGLEDFRNQKIPRPTIHALLAFAAAGYAIMLAHAYVSFGAGAPGAWHEWSFYRDASFHAALCFSAGLALWLLKIWPAGDAKLFSALGLFLPLMAPGSRFFPSWLYMIFLINTFMPPAAYIGLCALWYKWDTTWKHRWIFLGSLPRAAWGDYASTAAAEQLKKLRAASWNDHAARFFNNVAFVAICSAADLALFSFFPAAKNYRPLLLIGLSAIFQRIPDPLRKWLPAVVGAMAFPLFSMPHAYALLSAAVMGRLAFQWSAIGLGVKLAGALSRMPASSERDYVPWQVADLRAYLVLAPSAKKRIAADAEFESRFFSTHYPDGMTPAQTAALKVWCTENGIATIETCVTVHFAFWIFFGLLLTVVLKQDLLSFFRSGFHG